LAAILPKCYGLVPNNFMCSKPAFPNNLGANGGFPYTGINSIDFNTHLSNGLVLSGYFIESDPLSIFSNPNAKAHS
jgi:hypothetical protein